MQSNPLSLAGATIVAGLIAVSGLASPTAATRDRENEAGIEMQSEASLPSSQLAALRGATARFQRLDVALAEGYAPFGGCFSDPLGNGAMGYHYVNAALVGDPAIDPLRPELLLYERQPGGRMQLVGMEWITFVAPWHTAGNANPPALFGHEFHVNPTLLDEPFYLLHTWAWKHNPAGMFADWNPQVSCS